jgi:ParB-like chromosome segregation protein Spo0J
MPKTKRLVKKPRYASVVALPALPPEQLAALRENIAVNGVLVPILVDSDGPRRKIIDGNYRKQIADELDYDCPEIIHAGLDEEEKRTLARALNLARRQFSAEQKREVIADQLRETPDWSLRRTAKMLGVDHKTVASVRGDLHSTGEIPQFDKTVGLDGKSRSAAGMSQERYTPVGIVDAVRKVLKQIDLDPASSREANKIVKASTYFTRETNGLGRCWRGKVFLNPPFATWGEWLAKLETEMAAGRVKQAVIIGPPNIGAFRPLLLRGGLLFVPTERPKFYDPIEDRLVFPPFGSLVCYLGAERDRFVEVFGEQGLILRQV